VLGVVLNGIDTRRHRYGYYGYGAKYRKKLFAATLDGQSDPGAGARDQARVH
jgi:hypothetical protein